MGVKGALMAVIAMVGTVTMKYGVEMGLDPEVSQQFSNAFQWALLGIFSLLATWLSGQPQWERINRLIPAVIQYVEADIGNHPKKEKRNVAITMIIKALPEGKYGIKRHILRVPILGRYLVGRLLDQIVSGLRNITTELTVEDARVNLRKAKDKNKADPLDLVGNL